MAIDTLIFNTYILEQPHIQVVDLFHTAIFFYRTQQANEHFRIRY